MKLDLRWHGKCVLLEVGHGGANMGSKYIVNMYDIFKGYIFKVIKL